MTHLQNARSTTPMRFLPSAVVSAGGLALFLALLGVMLGPVALTPGQVFSALVAPEADPAAAAIVRNVRLPRVLLATLAGGLLGVAALLIGRITQREVRDPGWSGVAALGALCGVFALVQTPAAPPWAISLATVVGCSLGVALLVLVQRQRLHKWIGLVIALIAPVLSFGLLIGDVRIATWVRWSIGSFEQRDWTTLQGAGHLGLLALILLATHIAWPQRELVRWAAAGAATAAAILSAGALGLVGWLAGIWAVRSTNHRSGRLISASVFGAALLLGADLAARGLTTLLPSLGLVSELPVGAVLIVASLALVGGRRWMYGSGRSKDGADVTCAQS
jgi:iron complex transport system permease protein